MHQHVNVKVNFTEYLTGSILVKKKFKQLYGLAFEVRNITLKLIQYLSQTEFKGAKYKLREDKKKS